MRKSLTVLAVLLLQVGGCATTPSPLSTESDAHRASVAQIAAMESAAEVDPDDATAGVPAVDLSGDMLYELLIADIAQRRGHYDRSVEGYLRLAKQTQDPRLAERATRIALYARQVDEAQAAGELWVALDPNNIEARQSLAALYIKDGRTEQAVAHIEKILANTDAGTDNGFMVIASLLSREKDKRVALDVMRNLVATRPGNVDALNAYSHLAARLGELGEAASAIDKVLAIDPDSSAAIVQKSRILQAQGKTAQTSAFLQDVIKRHPNTAEYRLVYARMLADEDRFEDAYVQFEKLNEITPGNDDVVFALGFLALQLGRLDDAEKYLRTLVDRGGRGSEVMYYLGRLEEDRGDVVKAKRWYGQIKDGEHYINAQIRIVILKARAGDLNSARAHLDALKAQRPAHRLRLLLVEGEVLVEAEKYKDAMTLYNGALSEFADNADLLYARAMVAEKLDQLDLLEQDLRAILARDPNNAEALNALGYTLADRTDRYQEALELITRALELSPTDFFILDSLGWAHYRLGNLDEAVKNLRRALELKPDVEVAAHLGEVLWVIGDKESARKVWAQALDYKPQNKRKIILEVMRRFEQ